MVVVALMAMAMVVAQTRPRSRSKPVVGQDASEEFGLHLDDVCLQHLQRCQYIFPGRGLRG